MATLRFSHAVERENNMARIKPNFQLKSWKANEYIKEHLLEYRKHSILNHEKKKHWMSYKKNLPQL